MGSLHPTESSSLSQPMSDRLLVALLTAWSIRLHEALSLAQETLPNRPVTRSRVWKLESSDSSDGYAPVVNVFRHAMRRPPTESDNPDLWEWTETLEGHAQLQRLEDLLSEFDETIDMLAGGGG